MLHEPMRVATHMAGGAGGGSTDRNFQQDKKPRIMARDLYANLCIAGVRPPMVISYLQGGSFHSWFSGSFCLSRVVFCSVVSGHF